MKYHVSFSIALIALTSFAQTNLTGKARMLQRTGGYIYETMPKDAKVVALIEKREKTDRTLNVYQSALTALRIPSLIGDCDNAAVKLYLVDEGDFTVNLGNGTAIVPVGKDDTETQYRLNKALMALFSVESPILSQGGMLVVNHAMNAKNLARIRKATYKTACEEGWAPPPTNEFQCAIWNAAKAAATNAPAATPPAK